MRTNTIFRLRLAHLLFGMMFWYGIEQLFLNKYLHTASARGYLTIAFTASLIVFDIPGGILADRLGRKTALLLGCVAQTAGIIILGSSDSLTQYLIGVVVFGIFISLMNGAAQALLYDHLALSELSGTYGKLQGSMYALFLIGAGIANLASGFIAHSLGLRAPFFLSIIPSIMAFVLLLPIAEPPLSKAAAKWYAHLGVVLREIRAHPRIMVYGVQFMVSELVLLTIGEFGQIYILSFGVSTIALGVLWSIDAMFAAAGRLWAHRMQNRPHLTLVLYCAAMLCFALTRSALGIVLFWVVYGCNEALANIAEAHIQAETKSSVRATLFSTVSFMGNVLAIPAVFLFNHLYVTHSITRANLTASLAAIGILLLTAVFTKRLGRSSPTTT
ncbi:MAG TPA: MFS transporter [Candidatus Saccharimonadales bacterium]|nr:MFS transporter [Candidatus Saccharimonadales bacterium]